MTTQRATCPQRHPAGDAQLAYVLEDGGIVEAPAAALLRFLDQVQKHDDVWVCRRADIAKHWMGDR